MLISKKTFGKVTQIEKRYADFRYEKIADVPMEMWQTYEHFTEEPVTEAKWEKVEPGRKWGNDWLTAWFRGDITLSDGCTGKKAYVRAKTDGETLFIVDGKYSGVFDENHPVVMMTKEGTAGKSYHLAFEAYAGHHIPGAGPDEYNEPVQKDSKTFGGIELLLEREDVSAFVFDVHVLRQTANILDDNSLRKNQILKGLERVFEMVDAKPSETPEESWRPKLVKAREIMRPLLDSKNGPTTPWFGIIGHSHIDTAWLWPIAETWRKCARTFSSVLNIMEQYPEFIFVQSAPYHTAVIKERYPEIYDRIKERVAEGRWEPNGGMWVEPDCNIPSGEAFVRQLLVGQNATREMFGYTSNTLWMPDVFGYSAALPQILKGSNVDFFCTTKISWNDTNRFPYDTFEWKGIDGTSVISHFHNLQAWPEPENYGDQWRAVQHKDIQDRRLTAIGYGDGGGGPMTEMAEIARRVEDLEGSPKSKYVRVDDFMRRIKDELTELPDWRGELYLELHRGTLTSIAPIKRGNRKTEFAMRSAEFLCTLAALHGKTYPAKEFLELWKTVLVNQFHDILPGSSIARVNDEAVEAFRQCIETASKLGQEALKALTEPNQDNGNYIMAVNDLSWERELFELTNVPKGYYPSLEGVKAQWIEGVDGVSRLVVAGAAIPALGSILLPMSEKPSVQTSSFKVGENTVETPYAVVAFDTLGRISSFIDKASGRNIVKEGAALNTFLLGEDIPEYWDNWDIDIDQQLKMEVVEGFIRREVTAEGPVQLRLRSYYKISSSSTMEQDMIFYSDSPKVDFETKINWAEKHKLLKTSFHVDVFTDTARSEIQYGYVERPTHINLSQDRARFEVCNHKWTDLSEGEFGVALLNDCKYGIGINGSDMRLSLMKSGLRPDPRGDEGTHFFTYTLLPHNSGFSVEAVIRPAYELNIPVTAAETSKVTKALNSLLTVDAANIIVESIKWAENGEGFVVRFYDALKTGKKVKIAFNTPIKSVMETNMLEEVKTEIPLVQNAVELFVKPFEIKTLFCKI